MTKLSMALEILVAEDNEFNAQVLEQLIRERGHRGYIASSGNEALILIESVEFDLVILDLRMPGPDGFAVLERIRERGRRTGKHLPVIALTARARKEDRERCLAAGMDDFWVKPIDARMLWAVIEKLERAKDPEGTRLDAEGVTCAKWLDAKVLLTGCGGDAVILERIKRALAVHVPIDLARAEASWRAGDAVTLREAAHRLCGMLAAASSSVGHVASDLENEAAAGRLEEGGVLLERLGHMTKALLSEMERLSLDRLLGL
jgi:CheY-like chemotaxis protein